MRNATFNATANRILREFLSFRRVHHDTNQSTHTHLHSRDCQRCALPHLLNVISAVKQQHPVTFALPAFPGKSPNPEKVLGHLPDYAEKLSLHFLGNLCQKIKKFYEPGIKIILCSDGRVFSDVVGMQEHHITAYQIELNKLIEEMSLTDLSTFNLDDFYGQINFTQMRDELLKSYGIPLDFLKHKIRNGAKSTATQDEQESNHMYCGITRFLFEDTQYPEQTKSRSALLKESRHKAYEVIRRSNAWSQLIANTFPHAIRLSIHPQTCGSKKLGIRLIGNESWMTPWHGVAVKSDQGYTLMKRSEAETLGAQLIYSANGHPSHYTLLRNTL